MAETTPHPFPYLLIDTARKGVDDRYATRAEAEADAGPEHHVEYDPTPEVTA